MKSSRSTSQSSSCAVTVFSTPKSIWSGARPAPDAPFSPRRAGGMYGRKKFAENLVVSKSRCTFALATQKNGSSEVFGDP